MALGQGSAQNEGAEESPLRLHSLAVALPSACRPAQGQGLVRPTQHPASVWGKVSAEALLAGIGPVPAVFIFPDNKGQATPPASGMPPGPKPRTNQDSAHREPPFHTHRTNKTR